MDYKENLINYFRKNLKKGYPIESLKLALIRQGYTKNSVNIAAEKIKEELAKKAPILNEKPIIKYELFDENNKPIKIKKSFWKRILNLRKGF
jgi:hypothetical protein